MRMCTFLMPQHVRLVLNEFGCLSTNHANIYAPKRRISTSNLLGKSEDSLTSPENIASTSRFPPSDFSIVVKFNFGLPTIVVPLPSRREMCQFTLRPVSDTVGTLCDSLVKEDHGIEIVALYNSDGTRIARGTNIQHLLRYKDFRLRINDTYYDVSLPFNRLHFCEKMSTSEKATTIDDLKAKIASLHTIFNVDDFKLERERLILQQLEDVEIELKPMEIIRKKIDEECEKHSRRILWGGFMVMGLQTGVFARLTWYEYSWDIMEPVTYFATFSTVFATFGYYLLTNQNFEYSSAHRRIFTREFYKRAKKYSFNIERYNELSVLFVDLNRDLQRLRDPLLQHLPANRLSALESEKFKAWLQSTSPTDP